MSEIHVFQSTQKIEVLQPSGRVVVQSAGPVGPPGVGSVGAGSEGYTYISPETNPPLNPSNTSTWYATDTGSSYIRLNDQWIETSSVEVSFDLSGYALESYVDQAISDLKSTVYAVNVHGSDSNTARLTGYAGNIWFGTVHPVNAVDPDIIVRTDEAV